MTRKHLLDKDGDYCRFPHWEGNRLMVCGKPGYPHCELHSEIVSTMREQRMYENRAREASWNNHYLSGSR